jgi:hypothetical protein
MLSRLLWSGRRVQTQQTSFLAKRPWAGARRYAALVAAFHHFLRPVASPPMRTYHSDKGLSDLRVRPWVMARICR